MGDIVLGFIVGGIVAAIPAIVGGWYLLKNGEMQRKADQLAQERKERVEFRRRQLGDLYGPLYLERRRSERLRDQLPQQEPDGSRWRLVHHIEEVKEDRHLSDVVQRILDAGDNVADLIRAHGGLMEPLPPPEAFPKFMLHHELLKMSWESNEDQDPGGSHPFPGGVSSESDLTPCLENPGSANSDIDCAIFLGMRTIQADLEELLGLAIGSLSKLQAAKQTT